MVFLEHPCRTKTQPLGASTINFVMECPVCDELLVNATGSMDSFGTVPSARARRHVAPPWLPTHDPVVLYFCKKAESQSTHGTKREACQDVKRCEKRGGEAV